MPIPPDIRFRPDPAARLPLVLALVLATAGCRIPADAEGTTDAVRGAELRVGAIVTPLDPPDRQAVARVAEALGARLVLVEDDPHSLFARLDDGGVHLVAGAIPEDTPFGPRVALSDAFGAPTGPDDRGRRVLALRRGENRFLVAVNRAISGPAP